MENSELTFFNLCLNTIQKEKGMNLSQIADDLNVTLGYLSKVKTGKKPVSSKLLFDIRKLAGMTNTKALNLVANPFEEKNYFSEPNADYQKSNANQDVIGFFIKDNSAKTVQIDKLIEEISIANRTISILAEKLK